MQQADDFLAETKALSRLITPLSDDDYLQQTAFKGWTIDMVLRHLHFWNTAVLLSLQDEATFQALLGDLTDDLKSGTLTAFEASYLDGLSGSALRSAWVARAEEVAAAFRATDPSARLPWVGPDMSARSSVTARLMETWAHGQEIHDRLGAVRQNTDRIRNIVILGINTYGWTFRNRGEDMPGPMPFVCLTAPSGEVWTYGEAHGDERIEGLAEEFCQVVTQTRNIADTGLKVTGSVARDWMAKAQCFAGPAQDPPAPGTRAIHA